LANEWGTYFVPRAFANCRKGSRIADPLPDGFLRASVVTPLADPASSRLDARASHAAAAPSPLPERQACIARLPDIEGFELKGWRDCVSRAPVAVA